MYIIIYRNGRLLVLIFRLHLNILINLLFSLNLLDRKLLMYLLIFVKFENYMVSGLETATTFFVHQSPSSYLQLNFYITSVKNNTIHVLNSLYHKRGLNFIVANLSLFLYIFLITFSRNSTLYLYIRLLNE